jgi:dCMP deaminase
MERPNRIQLHLLTALMWAQRSTCKQPNRKISAVITNEDMSEILAIGYNGSPKQMPNDSCRNIPKFCGCLHAEMNCIAKVNSKILNKIMFVTMQPCEMCASLIAQSNIKAVYYIEPYRNDDGIKVLQKCGIEVYRVNIQELYPLVTTLYEMF